MFQVATRHGNAPASRDGQADILSGGLLLFLELGDSAFHERPEMSNQALKREEELMVDKMAHTEHFRLLR